MLQIDRIKWLEKLSGIKRPAFATTECQSVYSENKSRLLYYKSPKGDGSTPIFICYALINRFYILDLRDNCSFISYLVDRGFDVYFLDWGIPGAEDALFDMDYYIDGLLRRAFQYACLHAGVDRLNCLGYCLGGTIASIFAALYPEKIERLVLIASPIDFHKAGLLSLWTQRAYFNADALVKAYGNVPAAVIQSGFTYLNPELQWKKYKTFFKKMADPDFVSQFLSIEGWADDNVDFPGGFYRKYIQDLYQDNRLYLDTFQLCQKKVLLKSITSPILVISAKTDPIVPVEASDVILQKVTSPYKERIIADTGHIGIIVSKDSRKTVWQPTAEWFKAAF